MAKNKKLKFIWSNIPDDLYKQIVVRAEKSGRSISKEVLFIIKELLQK